MTSHILCPLMLCLIRSLQRPLKIRCVIIPHVIGEETKFQRGQVSFHGQTAHKQRRWDSSPGLSDFGFHGLSAGLHWGRSVAPVGCWLHVRGVITHLTCIYTQQASDGFQSMATLDISLNSDNGPLRGRLFLSSFYG